MVSLMPGAADKTEILHPVSFAEYGAAGRRCGMQHSAVRREAGLQFY